MRYTLKIDLKPKKYVIKEIKGIGAANAYEFDKTIHPETERQQIDNLGGVITYPADLQFKPDLSVASSFLRYNILY